MAAEPGEGPWWPSFRSSGADHGPLGYCRRAWPGCAALLLILIGLAVLTALAIWLWETIR